MRMETKLSAITRRAKEDPNCKFTSLAHLLTEDFLKECYQELKVTTPGVDGVTIKDYGKNLDDNISDLVSRMKAKRYIPKPVKRIYIPKGNGKRPIGIPATEDKVVQLAIKKILEAIFEQDFLDTSYGFRPNRSCHDAIDDLDKTIMYKPVNYILDMDIESFFDNIDRKILMDCLRKRITDFSLLCIIGRILKSGIMEQGEYFSTEQGIPQGSILSPILANIFLHYALDRWFQQSETKGFAKLIRYADDFVMCFQESTDARRTSWALIRRLKEFGLEISKKKSKRIKFGRLPWKEATASNKRCETFDFLGFTFFCDKTRKGYFKVGRKTSRKRLTEKLRDIKYWMKRMRTVDIKIWWPILKSKLLGHYRYYGVSGNFAEILKFYRQVVKLAFKWINRRSQKKSYNWEQFQKFLQYNPLPRPKIYHSYR